MTSPKTPFHRQALTERTEMPVSQELADAIATAQVSLSQNADGALLPYARNRVLAAMGPRQEAEDGGPTGLGWRRRTWLGFLTIRHLLPVWRLAYPADTGPERMLSLAERVLQGRADRQAAGAESNGYWDGLANSGEEWGDDQAPPVEPIAVGMAAARVVQTARLDYDLTPGDPSETDQDRDPFTWDESYLGSIAYAGGGTWQTKSSPARRREYWQWWLNQAVPEAYQAIT